MKMTEATVKALKLPAGKADHVEWDTAMPGFGVRCRPGSKSYLIQYRVGTKQRRVSLGATSKVSLDQAKKNARALFSKVAMKVDPANERAQAASDAPLTFHPVIDGYGEWLQAKVDADTPTATQRHHRDTMNFLKVYFRPLAGLTVSSINRQNVATELTRIKSSNGPMAMNHARAALSSFFTWAILTGLRDTNPVNGTEKTDAVKRERVLLPRELRTIWRALPANDHGQIVKLLMLTAQRRGEIGDLEVSEINWTERQIELPGPRTKNGLPHIIPLSDQALTILRKIDMTDRKYVFGRNLSAPFSGYSKGKKDLDKVADVAPWVLHDLRRTAATWMGEHGVLPHVVEAVLNHISGTKAGVAGTYNKATYLKEKRAALELLASHVETITA